MPLFPKKNTTNYDSTGTKCTGAAEPGAIKLRELILQNWNGTKDMGIYNCRNVRGGNTLSLHAEGRAIDIGASFSTMQQLAQWAVDYSGWYGIQEVIFNKKIWSSNKAYDGWRTYSGTNPHTDHVHIGLTTEAANDTNYMPGEIYGKNLRTALYGSAILLTGTAVLTLLTKKGYIKHV